MAQDGQEKKFSWLRHPIRAGSAWFDGPQISRREALLLGILGTLLVAAIFAILGVLLAAITVVNFEGKVPLWLAVGATVLALGLGAAGGAFAVRRLYHAPKLDEAMGRLETVESDRRDVEGKLHEANEQLQEVEDQLEKAKAEIADLEPHFDIRVRIESYAEQIRLLLSRGLGTGLEDLEEELLVEPAKLMEEMTDSRIHLSVWEPDVLGNGEAGWKVLHRADHTDRECASFGVPLDASWIAYTQKQRPDDAVFGLADLRSRPDVSGDDLTALRKAGFRSLLCSRVATGPLTGQRRENTACLVALARGPGAFSTVESRYLQFLGRLLSLHFQITHLTEQIAGQGA